MLCHYSMKGTKSTIVCFLSFILFQSSSTFVFSFTTSSSKYHNHNSKFINKNSNNLPLQMSARQQPQADYSKRTSTETIAIVGVTCSTLDKSSHLQSGVADLFKLYFEELYELGCDLGFQGFQSEWADLPGKYDFQKRGGLFVAVAINLPSAPIQSEDVKSREDGDDDFLFVSPGSDLPEVCGTTLGGGLTDSLQVVGCIAIRPLTETCGEVKRMYIRKSHRRCGVGKLLANAIVEQAWGEQCKFEEIKLDSLERLVGAVKLYENMGFQRIEPYCDCPEDDHVCMNLFKN